MKTKVKFISDLYGNYQDNYYTDNYTALINTLLTKVKITSEVNLGVTNGVIIENNFTGDFSTINCAIVEHDTQGIHLYKIIKKVFIRRGLWRLTMVKDMVSSKYNGLLNSKVLVSRLGIDRKKFDPLLFQKDILELSEVKTANNLLRQLPEAVSYGYLAIWARESLDGESVVWNSTATPSSIEYDISVNKLSDFVGYGLKTRVSYSKQGALSVKPTYSNKGFLLYGRVSDNTRFAEIEEQETSPFNYSSDSVNKYPERLLEIIESMSEPDDYGNTEIYVGKVIFDIETGTYYEVKRKLSTRKIVKVIDKNEAGYILDTAQFSKLKDAIIEFNETFYTYDYIPLRKVPVINETLPAMVNCVDQPFQMFFIPIIEDMLIKYNGGYYRSDKLITEAMLYDLISDYSGTAGKLLDVQIIPYSPIDGFANQMNRKDLVFEPSGPNLVKVITGTAPDDFIIPIYQVLYSSYSLFVPYVRNVEDYKLEQKKKYLVTSPSGASTYEFSVAKNRGLEGFFVDVDIRPYSTFHRVQPSYKGLYGKSYVDTRGLIWQEDTSLTIVTSAWETYKRQNINYMNSFNAEVNYKRSALSIDQQANWANYGFDAGKRLINAGVEAATFAAEAVAQDAWFGIKGGVSGGVGAAAIMIGQVAAEAIEATQLATNNRMDKKKLENEIDYSRQQFNYNVGNIKAIPENIEKVNGVFSTNNKIPYVQEFEPTEDEVKYYNEFLDLFGVNVGMMVDLSTKEFNYLQGSIIKFSEPITNEEYEELHNQLKRGARKYRMEA